MRHGRSKRAFRGTCAVVAAVLLFHSTSCGTIIYPERRGQPTTGRLDTDIVILDAIGLLLFFVPGVIAFAVDFATGAIYLPAGGKSRTGEVLGEVRVLPFDPSLRDPAAIAALVERETGVRVALRSPNVVIWRGEAGDDTTARVRALNREIAEGPAAL